MSGKYNFVFFFDKSEWAHAAYADLTRLDNVRCVFFPLVKDKRLSLLHRMHHNPRLNSLFQLPGHSLWFSRYFTDDFSQKHQLCFVFDARWMHYPFMHQYAAYLRRQHHGCKLACYYFDLVKSYPPQAQPSALHREFDMLLTYDKAEAQLHGMAYHPTSFSTYTPSYSGTIEPTDVFFLGRAKGRLDAIHACYEQLTAAGLRCSFFLAGMADAEHESKPGLHFIASMSYDENLARIQASRCILEVQQPGAQGPTLRTWESICYGKCLITNNSSLSATPFYSPDYVTFIAEGKIDTDYIQRFQPRPNPLREAISPKHLLNFIEDKL